MTSFNSSLDAQDILYGSLVIGTGINGQTLPNIYIGAQTDASGILDPTTVTPFNAIHSCDNILHDVTHGTSGTLCYEGANKRIALFQNTIATQFVTTVSASGQAVFEAYDSVGGQVIADILPGTPIQFNNVRVNTDPTMYFLANQSELTILQAGTFEVENRISIRNSSGANRTTSVIAIYRNGVEEPGSRAFGYHRLFDGGHNSMGVRIILSDVQPGDTFITYALQLVGIGPLQTIANGSSVSIRKLF